MIIEIISDYSCPFCYLAEKRYTDVLKSLNANIQIKHTCYQLDEFAPKTTRENVYSIFAKKYGVSEEVAKDQMMPLKKNAQDEGFEFNFDKIQSTHTLLAHQFAKAFEEKYKDDKGNQIKLFDANQLRPLEVRFADANINTDAFKVSVVASSSSVDATTSAQELVLTQDLNSTILIKKLKIYPDGHYDLTVSATNDKQFFITNGFRPNVLADMYAVHGFISKLNDNSLKTIEDGQSDKNESIVGAKFISSFDRYYATVIYNFDKSLAITVMPDSTENLNPQAFIHAGSVISFSGLIGPKNHKDLEALNPELIDVIDYGWFTFIAKPMFILLQFIQSYVGNWGWTIVILTILIKLVLYPLSFKGMVSMQKLKDLAPKMKEIQVKYKDDKQKQSMHMMELYKKHGANPMGGCLPLILQIPVFFAIYRVLLNAIELKGAPWMFWVHDLAEMDPYFVLPILMGATMFLQQKITPNTMQDEMQKKIFQFLPIIFTFFFLWFPAGLTLYWFINNLFTIGQQYYINSVFERKRAEKN